MIEIDNDAIKTENKNIIATGAYKTDDLPSNMDSDIDHMVATYARLKDLDPDIAARVLLGGDVLNSWRKRNTERK